MGPEHMWFYWIKIFWVPYREEIFIFWITLIKTQRLRLNSRSNIFSMLDFQQHDKYSYWTSVFHKFFYIFVSSYILKNSRMEFLTSNINSQDCQANSFLKDRNPFGVCFIRIGERGLRMQAMLYLNLSIKLQEHPKSLLFTCII